MGYGRRLAGELVNCMNDATAEATANGRDSRANAEAILQVKVWLLGVSPMVWRRLLVPSRYTLRELHGVIQVAMGWEGIDLYDFELRVGRYGARELSASSPDVTLTALHLRKGARFVYEYDLNIRWRHEVRIEASSDREPQRPIPGAPAGAVLARPRIAAARSASWPAVTTGSRSTLSRTWVPWQRSCSGSWTRKGRTRFRMSSIKTRAGAWKTPPSGQRRARRPRDGPFRDAR